MEAKLEKREILILLFLRSIRSSNRNGYNYNKRINGLIRLKETNEFVWRIGNEGIDSSEKIKQKIAKH